MFYLRRFVYINGFQQLTDLLTCSRLLLFSGNSTPTHVLYRPSVHRRNALSVSDASVWSLKTSLNRSTLSLTALHLDDIGVSGKQFLSLGANRLCLVIFQLTFFELSPVKFFCFSQTSILTFSIICTYT